MAKGGIPAQYKVLTKKVADIEQHVDEELGAVGHEVDELRAEVERRLVAHDVEMLALRTIVLALRTTVDEHAAQIAQLREAIMGPKSPSGD